MSELVIKTHNLSKSYGAFEALKDLNLSVQRGEIFGYLGPNGAGKTTTIRMLLDLIRPTSGKATILGMDAQADSVDLHRKIGFLPGELALWNNQKSGDIVHYFGQIRGGVDMDYVHELTELLQFDMGKKVREYSSGNKRKLGLILALMNKPELLILDEPTSGLDPLMQQTFNQLMLDIAREGHTVFLSSHSLSEVQAICDRVGVLRNGELRAVERVETLTHADFSWVTIKVRQTGGIVQELQRVDGVTEVTIGSDNQVQLRLQGDFDPLLRALNTYYVVAVKTNEPTLEEIFLAYYGERQVSNGHVTKEMME